MEELPSGTVTFLFTDIEGSTRRWEADAEGMRAALADHDDVVRSAVEYHGGIVFKHTGDGICAAFSSATDAVRAAVEAQRRLLLPVRMGVVTGSAEHQDGDYSGPVLNRAARVMAAGHGGQILLGSSTVGLIERIHGVDLVDLGQHRLRDLSGAQRLFQVRGEGLAAEFPALRTAEVVPAICRFRPPASSDARRKWERWWCWCRPTGWSL
jgi:class 3 adenylate cyclase